MLKIVAICSAAGFVVCPLSRMPAAPSHVESDAPMGAPTRGGSIAAKGDRLDIGARGGACSQRAWPYYDFDSACLYDGMLPADEVHKVRLVFANRFPIAQ